MTNKLTKMALMKIQVETLRVNENRRNLNYPHSTYLNVYRLFIKFIVFALKFV